MSDVLSIAETKSFSSERERFHQQMLSSVSHDLKTPLASIIGSLEIHQRMKGALSEEKKAMLLETALQEAYRLDNFITNILDIAKLENGMIKPRPQEMLLPHALQDCVAGLGVRTQQASIIIQARTGSRDTFITDNGLFCRAVSLLVDNALRYSTDAPDVLIEYYVTASHCHLCVADRGQGIPVDKLALIFDKYTRLQKADHQQAGTGLGLAICRAIATLLGGEVHAENREGSGSVFLLTLPAMAQ